MTRKQAFKGAVIVSILLATGLFTWTLLRTNENGKVESDWRSEWAVPQGFALTIDTQGYEYPTAIAFVPNAGTQPKDPLYFVTELKGRIKVVTNDRSVQTFAEGFYEIKPVRSISEEDTLEVGLAGICLEPTRGYVFATHSYHDSKGVLRNNVTRFQSDPNTFSTRPMSTVSFSDIFSSDESSNTHQIGGCQATDGLLYVSVGDGLQARNSAHLDSTNGKILRMTLEGEPFPGNPYYESATVGRRVRSYVFASGLRNPFGLKVVDGRVFAADNGPATDRFLEVEAGRNYLWDGTSRSIGARALAFLYPGNGVAQLDFDAAESSFLREFAGKFLLAVTGSPILLDETEPPQVLVIDYKPGEEALAAVPEPIVIYRGQDIQVIPGVAVGPDALYVVSMLPTRHGSASVLRIASDPNRSHPIVLGRDATRLISLYGCYSCHTLNNRGNPGPGPVIDRAVLIPRLQTRLTSEQYSRQMAIIDSMDIEPFTTFKSARREVLGLNGMNQIKIWLKYHLLQPRFDNPNAQMPILNMTENEAAVIADYLLTEPEDNRGFFERVRNRLYDRAVRKEILILGLVVGFSSSAVAIGVLIWVVYRIRLNRVDSTVM